MDVMPLLHVIRFYIRQVIMYASIDNTSPAGVTCLSRYGVPPIFVKKYQYIQTFPRQRTRSNTKKKNPIINSPVLRQKNGADVAHRRTQSCVIILTARLTARLTGHVTACRPLGLYALMD